MEINNLSEYLTKEEVIDFCKKLNENIEVINFNLTDIDDDCKGKGFLGHHCCLNVLINRKINNQQIVQNKLKFFVKLTPTYNATQMEYCEGFGVFKKEKNVYKCMLPQLTSAINRNYTINNCNNIKYKFAPKCYLAKDNIIILENLKEKGFRLVTNLNGTFDYEHLLCALKSLASLHSSSIIFEFKIKKSIQDSYKNCVVENSYPIDKNNIRSIVFQKAANALCELLKLIPKYTNLSNLNDIIQLFRLNLEKIFEFCETSKKFRNVFNHGDLWANNIMFKYSTDSNNNINEKLPIECCFVDFQLARYSPPVMDIMTLITIQTSSEFRKIYLNDLLDNYYKFLTDYLNENQININNVITKEEYHETIEHYKLAGLIESCLFSHTIRLPQDIVASMLQNSNDFDEFLSKNRNEVCIKAFKNNKIYRDCLTDVITDLVDNYILPNLKNK